MNGLGLGSARSLVCLNMVISIQANGPAAKAVNAATTPKLTTFPAAFRPATRPRVAITSPPRGERDGAGGSRTRQGPGGETAPPPPLRRGQRYRRPGTTRDWTQ